MIITNCAQVSEELLKRHDVTQKKFISQLVIQDETYIHNFDSDSEQQSMQRNERIVQKFSFYYSA